MPAKNTIDRHQQRKQLLASGYHPIPLNGKRPTYKGWSRQTITDEWLEGFARKAAYGNTGLRCDNLIAFDIDVEDPDWAEEFEDLIEAAAGPTDFCRFRDDSPRCLLLYRVKGEPGRKRRTGTYEGHCVELLAGPGAQFAAYGVHPDGQPYQWDRRGPLDGEPPELEYDAACAILDTIEKAFIGSGMEQDRKPSGGAGSGGTVHDMHPDTEVMVEGEIVTWGDLKDTLDTQGVFGNLYRKEYEAWGDSDGVHFYLTHGGREPCAHDFVHDTTHYSATVPKSLADTLPDKPTGDMFTPTEVEDIAGHCVMVKDGTVRDIRKPLIAWQHGNFVRTLKHLNVPDPARPDKTLPFSRAWEQSPASLRADLVAMRPDLTPGIVADDHLKVLNAYVPPSHPDTGGEVDTFFEFMAHLVPDSDERELALAWIANKVQNPHHRQHGLVMVTPTQGTGRGTLATIIGHLLGPQYCRHVELPDLVGHGSQGAFNGFLADSLLVRIDEALESATDSRYHSRKMAYERLKTVCDPNASTMQIKRKYGTNTDEMVFASLLIQSNHTDAIAIEPDDRRLLVLRNTDTPLVDAPGDLYGRIFEWLEGSHWRANIGALWRNLSAREYQYNPFGIPPLTDAKRTMLESGQSDIDWLFARFVEDMPGDIVTFSHWRQYVYRQRAADPELDLPAPHALDGVLNGVLRKRTYRMLEGRQIKVKGAKVRPWAIRNLGRWRGHTKNDEIRAELEKNGDPGSNVVAISKQLGST